MADQLATPENLASLLQQDLDLATATLLIECATAVVQAAAGGQRIVQVVADTAVLDLDEYDHGTWLSLPQTPVTAVTAVAIGATTVTDYTAQLSRGRLYRADGWRSTLILYPSAPSTVTVTTTHGYAAGDQRLQLARGTTLMLARGPYDNPTGVVREQIDDYAAQYAAMSANLAANPALSALLRQRYGRPRRSVKLLKG